MNADWQRLQALALEEVESTITALPEPLREPARKLPVTFEHVPNGGLVEDGIEPDTLGLFVGPDFTDEGSVPMPPQVILFLETTSGTLRKGMKRFSVTKCIRRICTNSDITSGWMRMN